MVPVARHPRPALHSNSTPLTETCAICGGTGWKTIERDKEREAVRCACRIRATGEHLWPPHTSRHATSIASCRTSNAIPTTTVRRVFAMPASWLAAFWKRIHPVRPACCLSGSVGVGKTHLSVGIMKELIHEKGMPSLAFNYGELLKSIPNSYNPPVAGDRNGNPAACV